mgnify:CR=1 FL=1
MDQLSDKKNSEEHWVEDLSLGEAMQRLPDRERRIIDMRFLREDPDRGCRRNPYFAGAGVTAGEECVKKHEALFELNVDRDCVIGIV